MIPIKNKRGRLWQEARSADALFAIMQRLPDLTERDKEKLRQALKDKED